MSARFTRIDNLTIGQHRFLEADDFVLFFGEYTVNGGYNTETNSKILGFKINPQKRITNPGHFRHKEKAIDYWSEKLKYIVPPNRIGKIAWCPIPCSKPINHAEYDDRLHKLIRRSFGNSAFILDAITQRSSRVAAHDTGDRPDPARLISGWNFMPKKLPDPIDTIVVFDDVITRGASFKAAQALLSEHYVGYDIKGVFLARSVHDSDPNDLFSLFD